MEVIGVGVNGVKNRYCQFCSRTKRRPSCLRYGKTHRPNIDPTQLDKHKRAVWSASDVHISDNGALAKYISPRVPIGDASTHMEKWSDQNGTRNNADESTGFRGRAPRIDLGFKVGCNFCNRFLCNRFPGA